MNISASKPAPHVPAGMTPATPPIKERLGAVPGTAVILTALGMTIVIAWAEITLPAVAPEATRSSSCTGPAVAGAVYVAFPSLVTPGVTGASEPPPVTRKHCNPPNSAAGLRGDDKNSRSMTSPTPNLVVLRLAKLSRAVKRPVTSGSGKILELDVTTA